MESIRLFILKIILSSIILNFVLACNKDSKVNNYIQTTLTKEKTEKTINLNDTGRNKLTPARTTRSAYRRNWSESYLGHNNNMPPYLVFNRKTGSYYPYYTYPKDNTIRRSGPKGTKKWSH